MHINRIEIKGFGKLNNRVLSFGKGINLIYGENEAGKSTVQWFIRAMLYGLKSGRRSSTGLPAPHRRYMPWDGSSYKGAMSYTLDDGSSFRIERDFEKNTIRIFDSLYNDITETFEHGRDKLPMFADAQLGIDEAAFDNTVFIRQMKVRLDPDGSSDLAARLANTESSCADGLLYQRAEAALTDALRNRVGTDRTRTQPLDKLEAELKKLESEHVALAGRQKQRESLRSELTEVKRRLSRLEECEHWLNELGRLIEIRKKIDAGMKKEACLCEAASNLEDVEGRLSRLRADASTLIKESDRNKDPVSSLKKGELALRSEIDRNTQDSTGSKVKSRAFTGKALPVVCLAAALVSAALFVHYLTDSGLNDIQLISFIYLLFTGIFAAVGIHLFRRTSAREKNEQNGMAADPKCPEPISAYESGVYSIHEKTEALEELKKNQLNSVSLIFGKKMECIADIRHALGNVQAELEELSRRLQSGLDAADRDNLPSDGFFAQKELDILIYDMDIASLESEWKAETERVRQQLLETALREKYCEGQLDDSSEEADRLQRVEEETVAVNEKITYLRNKGNALKMAHEVLTEAAAEIRRTIAPELNMRMSSTISGLTGNKYFDLRGDDKLLLKAALPGSGDVKEVSALSGGTADQMYLALRLAMAGLLTKGSESLPLMMDEVFSQYDDKRTKLALEYLNREYKNRQILLFTCKKREVEMAGEIIGCEMNFVELGHENP